jgi:hypothetical protein
VLGRRLSALGRNLAPASGPVRKTAAPGSLRPEGLGDGGGHWQDDDERAASEDGPGQPGTPQGGENPPNLSPG